MAKRPILACVFLVLINTSLPVHAQKARDLMGYELGMSAEGIQTVSRERHPSAQWARTRGHPPGLPMMLTQVGSSSVTITLDEKAQKAVLISAMVRGSFAKEELRHALIEKYGKPTQENYGLIIWSHLRDGKPDTKNLCKVTTDAGGTLATCGTRIEVMYSGAATLDGYLVHLWDLQAIHKHGLAEQIAQRQPSMPSRGGPVQRPKL
jgi:hypothetical protein